MKRRRARLTVTLLLLALLGACDNGQPVAARRPAGETLRVVTLSPHLGELVFAVGAGELLVGVSAYTDYPPEAATIPRVGDAFSLDQEQLALLQPDLLLAWDTGTPAHVVDELRDRGYRIAVIRTTSLADVPGALLQIGKLTGHEGDAAVAAGNFEQRLAALTREYADASPIRVFYQVDARPLYTVTGKHFVSEIIEICGGTNIFGELEGLAPVISVEAVLERDPEVILASSDAGSAAFAHWDRWTELAANRYGNRFIMPANEIGRPTPRLLRAADAVCDALESARENRKK